MLGCDPHLNEPLLELMSNPLTENTRHTHGERPLVVHLSHRDVSSGRVHHEHLLIVTQLELCVEGVNHGNGPVGLLEGDRHQKPAQRHKVSLRVMRSLNDYRLEPWEQLHLLFRSMRRAGQGLVSGVDPGLSGLDGAGDQEDCVLSRIVLPV